MKSRINSVKKRIKIPIKAVRNEWDEVYRGYPLQEIPWYTSKPEKHLVELVENGEIFPGDALDMCSGAAANSIYLAEKGFRVTGIDVSPTAVAIANRECKKRGLGCSYYPGDVLKFKVPKKFDFVFDRGCFHHMENWDKPLFVKRVHSFLKKNGKMFLQCFSDKNLYFRKNLSKEDIRRYFSNYFDIIFIKESVHIEPDGRKVYMYDTFMKRR